MALYRDCFPFLGAHCLRKSLYLYPEATISTSLQKKERIRLMTVPRRWPSSSLACDANHVTRLPIPAAMREKEYSNVEAGDQILVQQVRLESQKNEAGNTHSPKSAARSSLLTQATGATAARPALRTITPNQSAALVVVVGGINAMCAQPLLLPKERAMPKEVRRTTVQVITQVEG